MGSLNDWKRACREAEEFNAVNGLPPTNFVRKQTLAGLGLYVSVGGHFNQGLIYVATDKCEDDGMLSHAGAVDDCTVRGVVAHELGHHVWYCLARTRKQKADMSGRWKEIVLAERAVSEYKPFSPKEAMAEAVRLFLLNPNLLKAVWPVRHSCLAEEMELRPIVDAPWQEVLRDADELHHSKIRRLLSCK